MFNRRSTFGWSRRPFLYKYIEVSTILKVVTLFSACVWLVLTQPLRQKSLLSESFFFIYTVSWLFQLQETREGWSNFLTILYLSRSQVHVRKREAIGLITIKTFCDSGDGNLNSSLFEKKKKLFLVQSHSSTRTNFSGIMLTLSGRPMFHRCYVLNNEN